jgi:hypothetical protein
MKPLGLYFTEAAARMSVTEVTVAVTRINFHGLKDSESRTLNGENNYRLHVPLDVV